MVKRWLRRLILWALREDDGVVQAPKTDKEAAPWWAACAARGRRRAVLARDRRARQAAAAAPPPWASWPPDGGKDEMGRTKDGAVADGWPRRWSEVDAPGVAGEGAALGSTWLLDEWLQGPQEKSLIREER